ncbi:MAG: ATP-dependent Clp protease ATP-binding subunit [Oscillospiraceae bacterium]|nr:ATP-dependent Clp protease ATP-binding subunit [Oscillospiraceae bacterium]
MLCSRCKKRTAVVFITAIQGEENHNEGLCLVCAKQLGIPQVKEYMDQMGMTDQDVEEISDELTDITENDDGGFFKKGGTAGFPNFLQNLMGGLPKGFEAFAKSEPNGEEDSTSGETVSEETEKKSKGPRQRKMKSLETYCDNLSQKAEDGKLDHIVGREKEIARTIQILSRRQKNNPCLIGEPGVGKTAIAEGIAQKIAAGEVPFNLKDKKVYLLDLTALIAGTQFRGQFESRMKALIDEIKNAGNIILFVDEIHNLVGTGGDNEGSMNAANILKPALSRGEVQVIGATTFKEYRKYIEKDSALERRFQPVTVNEPSVSETEQVLFGIRQYYEEHHKVKITDELLRMCAVLSERYINDRFLPDKAIDLLDEACACRSIRSTELSKLDSVKKELEKEEQNVAEIEEAAEPDFEKLANAKAEVLRLKKDLEEAEAAADKVYVTEEDLSKVIELWTGIPASKVVESEYTKLENLENKLREKIIGQDEAVSLVCKAIKRTRVQLSKRRRPASFIFVGPTGVGKTELVKVLASELFDGTDPLIRLDMTEYMEKYSVSRLIGSPPGYVGYDEAGQLTEKVRRKPYSVVLFDEIEKAHPDVMNILLQILDEGRVTDSQGRTVNFENTIIVMTSNAGSTDKSTGIGFNKTESEVSKEKSMKALSDFLRPEFLSRIDEIVTFAPLTKENYESIAALMLDEMKDPLAEKGITLKYSKKALTAIADKAFGQKFGARDIRRVIREEIEDKVAELIITSTADPFKTIKIGEKKGELEITKE